MKNTQLKQLSEASQVLTSLRKVQSLLSSGESQQAESLLSGVTDDLDELVQAISSIEDYVQFNWKSNSLELDNQTVPGTQITVGSGTITQALLDQGFVGTICAALKYPDAEGESHVMLSLKATKGQLEGLSFSIDRLLEHQSKYGHSGPYFAGSGTLPCIDPEETLDVG